MVLSAFVGRTLSFLRRYVAVLLLLLLVLGLVWLRVRAPLSVVAHPLDRGAVVRVAFGRGTIESQREAAVGFDLVGRLSEVLVDEGARVTLGQELARLETNQAEADLHSAQTGVAAARSSLLRLSAEEERGRALLATAEREAARAESLLSAGAISSQQRDEAADHLRLARADLDRVLAQRSEATRGIELAAGGAEQRRVAMVRATLLAPFDGVVTRRLREPGDTVALGSTVLRIVDTSRVYVSAALDETVLPRLAEDQQSTILFPGENQSVSGRVTRISWEADRQTHELIVEVTPERLERRVAIGQRADVRIEVDRRENVLRLPIGMLYHDGSGAYAFADRDGKLKLVRPTLGLAGDDYVEVLDGLAEGDIVLASGASAAALSEGRRWEAE